MMLLTMLFRRTLNEIVFATVVGVDCNAPSYNPIWRVPVVVRGDQGCVQIDVVLLSMRPAVTRKVQQSFVGRMNMLQWQQQQED